MFRSDLLARFLPRAEPVQTTAAQQTRTIARGQVLNLRAALELRAGRYASTRVVCPDCEWPNFFGDRYCQNPVCLGDLRNVPANR